MTGIVDLSRDGPIFLAEAPLHGVAVDEGRVLAHVGLKDDLGIAESTSVVLRQMLVGCGKVAVQRVTAEHLLLCLTPRIKIPLTTRSRDRGLPGSHPLVHVRHAVLK